MSTKNILTRLVLLAVGSLILGTAAYAQANTDVTLTVTNNPGSPSAGSRTLHFGVNTGATYGINSGLGEVALPPFPPSGPFEARFVPDPDAVSPVLAGTEGSPSDFHPSTSGSQLDTHWVKIAPGTSGTPITITWSSSSVAAQYGTCTMTYGTTTINMRTTGSATISSASQAGDVRVFTASPVAPPSGITSSPCPLDFGAVLPGSTNNRTLTLTNSGSGTIDVDSIRISNTNYTITSPSIPASFTTTQAVNVRFVAPGTNGVQSGTITIYFRDGTGAHTQTCSVTANVSSGEGLYFVGGATTDTIADNHAGYTKKIGLKYSGSTPAQGIQFDLVIPNNLLKVASITLGTDITVPANWTFDYEVQRAASSSSVRVLLYGKDTTVNLPALSDNLLVVRFDAANIRNCNAGLGHDDSTALMYLTNVQSALATNLGNSAGIGIDANRDTANYYVVNSSSRGDVNCDDRVDVLDLLTINDNILGRLTLAPWQINRADLAPWGAYWAQPGSFFSDANNYGNGQVNVQDLVLITNAILNQKWPDGDVLWKTHQVDGGDADVPAPGAMSKASQIYDVKFSYEVSNSGIKVGMNNLVPVKGYQMTLKATDAPANLVVTMNPAVTTPFSVSYKVVDGEIRVVAITKNGESIAPMNGNLLDMPFTISNPSMVSLIEPIIAGGQNNEGLRVEYEVIPKVSGVNEAVANAFRLENLPNPFTGTTIIRYSLPNATTVTLVVRDANGNVVARPISNKTEAAGAHAVDFNGKGLASGAYFYTLTADGVSTTQRMVLAR